MARRSRCTAVLVLEWVAILVSSPLPLSEPARVGCSTDYSITPELRGGRGSGLDAKSDGRGHRAHRRSAQDRHFSPSCPNPLVLNRHPSTPSARGRIAAFTKITSSPCFAALFNSGGTGGISGAEGKGALLVQAHVKGRTNAWQGRPTSAHINANSTPFGLIHSPHWCIYCRSPSLARTLVPRT